jgi:hypothetical protein
MKNLVFDGCHSQQAVAGLPGRSLVKVKVKVYVVRNGRRENELMMFG